MQQCSETVNYCVSPGSKSRNLPI